MVVGHLTVTSAAHRLLRKRFAAVSWVPLGWLVLGAYLPDLVDKPANVALGLSGRGFGHSLVVQAVVFSLLLLLLPRRRLVVSTLALGACLHLLEDGVDPKTLLAPLLGPVPLASRWEFLDSFVRFYTRGGPPVWLEAAAGLYWLAVGLRAWLSPSPETAADALAAD